MAERRWLSVAAALLSTGVLLYAIYSSLTNPSAAVSVPVSALALAVSRKRPELAALLAFAACVPLLPQVDLLGPLGPLAPLPRGGGS